MYFEIFSINLPTSINLNGVQVEVVQSFKLLGVNIEIDLF